MNNIRLSHFTLNWLLTVVIGSFICALPILSFEGGSYRLFLVFLGMSFISSAPAIAILYFFLYLQRKKSLKRIKVDFRIGHLIITLLTVFCFYLVLKIGVDEAVIILPYYGVGTIIWEIRFKKLFKAIPQTQNNTSETQ